MPFTHANRQPTVKHANRFACFHHPGQGVLRPERVAPGATSEVVGVDLQPTEYTDITPGLSRRFYGDFDQIVKGGAGGNCDCWGYLGFVAVCRCSQRVLL